MLRKIGCIFAIIIMSCILVCVVYNGYVMPMVQRRTAESKKENKTKEKSKEEKSKEKIKKVEKTYASVDVNTDPVLGDFGFNVLRNLYEKGERNVLISPDSVLSALSMTATGANGDTLKQMNQVMQSGDNNKLAESLKSFHSRLESFGEGQDSNGGFAPITAYYKVANSIWTRDGYPVKNEFVESNKNNFSAEIQTKPFDDSTVNDINMWVANRTDNMIPNIINSLSPDDKMMLINAICFEGQWQKPYGQTEEGTFTNTDGETKTVDMMVSNKKEKTYMEMNGGKGFIKRYITPPFSENTQFAFFAFLPPEGTDIGTYLKDLNGQEFKKAYENIMERMVIAKLPKFSIDYSNSLNNTLTDMGMKDAFTDQADFSGISDNPLKISDVIHKTHIEIDEEGTKAAAVTAGMTESTSIMMDEAEEVELNFDRPFLYGIMDEVTGQPVFIGVADDLGK